MAIILECMACIITLIAIIVVVIITIDSCQHLKQPEQRWCTSIQSFIQFAPASATCTMQSEDIEMGNMINSVMVQTKDA